MSGFVISHSTISLVLISHNIIISHIINHMPNAVKRAWKPPRAPGSIPGEATARAFRVRITVRSRALETSL